MSSYYYNRRPFGSSREELASKLKSGFKKRRKGSPIDPEIQVQTSGMCDHCPCGLLVCGRMMLQPPASPEEPVDEEKESGRSMAMALYIFASVPILSVYLKKKMLSRIYALLKSNLYCLNENIYLMLFLGREISEPLI